MENEVSEVEEKKEDDEDEDDEEDEVDEGGCPTLRGEPRGEDNGEREASLGIDILSKEKSEWRRWWGARACCCFWSCVWSFLLTHVQESNQPSSIKLPSHDLKGELNTTRYFSVGSKVKGGHIQGNPLVRNPSLG